jgi:putative intracellular protease/amidase
LPQIDATGTIERMSKILVVVTSHADWPATGRKTGYWVGEVSHFVEIVEAAGHEVDIVSPLGGEPPVDHKSVSGPQSLDGGPAALNRNETLRKKLVDTLRPDQVVVSDYAAIYYAGGHGTMFDFPDNGPIAAIAAEIYERGGIVSAVCHGVTGLLNVRLSDGRYLIDGRPVTGFANVEERLMGLADKVPYLTETRMRERGGDYRRGAPFFAYAIVDGRLITGQNPRSSKAVAKHVVSALAG